MRPVGAALGIPRHPIDVGEDVDTVAAEVSEFNWYNDSKADGGSGICQGSKVTACLRPLNLKTGWTSFIVPGQVQIVYRALLNNDPRPFFMHQSNLTGDRLGYPVMDGILSAYGAVYAPSAPIANLPMSGDRGVLRHQQLSAPARHAGELWEYTKLGWRPIKIVLPSDPYGPRPGQEGRDRNARSYHPAVPLGPCRRVRPGRSGQAGFRLARLYV